MLSVCGERCACGGEVPEGRHVMQLPRLAHYICTCTHTHTHTHTEREREREWGRGFFLE